MAAHHSQEAMWMALPTVVYAPQLHMFTLIFGMTLSSWYSLNERRRTQL